ncbi:hypothetical protein [Cohnella luojiensis]|uniref:DUF4367 domain-containing protein n=1 Tax=Cohnella luojiensis TaxID=652876 RepID=A0A4Y8LNR5_9BACL|nr:hypothetical protein [Cohnella luojiensis]TFE19878.1 hypothetical protein E2980_21720 [Cohnella luojiensis]
MNRLESRISHTLKEHLDSHFPQASFDDVWKTYLAENSNRPRKTVFITLFAIVLIMTTAFSYYRFNWGNTKVIVRDSNEDLTNYKTPLDTFEGLTEVEGAKTYNLMESRKKADFVIRQPSAIKPWEKIKSVGVVLPARYKKEGKTRIGDAPLYYLDLYVNPSNQQRIVVTQSYDASMSSALKKKSNESYSISYPKGSQILNGFGTDIAVLMNLQKGRYNLQIHHKEENNNATLIDVWGNTDPEILEDFVRKYLSATWEEETPIP